jgi:hypothetical protein
VLSLDLQDISPISILSINTLFKALQLITEYYLPLMIWTRSIDEIGRPETVEECSLGCKHRLSNVFLPSTPRSVKWSLLINTFLRATRAAHLLLFI